VRRGRFAHSSEFLFCSHWHSVFFRQLNLHYGDSCGGFWRSWSIRQFVHWKDYGFHDSSRRALIVLTGRAWACGFVIYESYGKLTDFSDEFPSYVIAGSGTQFLLSAAKIERVQDSAGKLQHEASPKKVPEVRVQQSTSWASYLVRGVGFRMGAR